tara:strand:+ start:6865 stop:7332 length:468 start_codon:yes stop_codon:yes gene_type:complete
MTKNKIEPKIFAIDFDGTSVGFGFPLVGPDIGAAEVMRDMVAAGHRIILHTMRSDKENLTSDNVDILCPKAGDDANYLSQAVMWFKENDIPLFGVNINPEQYSWTDSPKPYADYYIDDIAIGCPTMVDPKISSRPFVDWIMIRSFLEASNLINLK